MRSLLASKIAMMIVALWCAQLASQSPISPQQGKVANPVVAQNSKADIVQRVLESTVKVEAFITFDTITKNAPEGAKTESNTRVSFGTGFIADDQWHVATADHIVDPTYLERSLNEDAKADGRQLVQGTVRVTAIRIISFLPNIDDANSTNIYDVGMGFEAKILKQDYFHDVAILSAKTLFWQQQSQCQVYRHCDGYSISTLIKQGKPFEVIVRPAEVQVKQPAAGNHISLLGFPKLINDPNGPPGAIMEYGKIEQPLHYDSEHRPEYLAEIPGKHGDSGGPVFLDSDGRVIGIASRAYPPKRTLSGAFIPQTTIVPMKYIQALLSQAPKEIGIDGK